MTQISFKYCKLESIVFVTNIFIARQDTLVHHSWVYV